MCGAKNRDGPRSKIKYLIVQIDLRIRRYTPFQIFCLVLCVQVKVEDIRHPPATNPESLELPEHARGVHRSLYGGV